MRVKALYVFVLFLGLGSGCTLLFTSPGQDSEIDSTLDPAIELTIGTEPSDDFSTYTSWLANRSGNLLMRQLLRVEVEGEVMADDQLSALGSGCSGLVRAASEDAVYSSLLTLDTSSDIACQPGDLLRSSRGDMVTVLAVSTRGVQETATVNKQLWGPIIIRDFTSDERSYIHLRAGRNHGGLPGRGIEVSIPGEPAHAIDIGADYTRVTGFEVTQWSTGAGSNGSFEGVHVEANFVVLDRLLVHDDGATEPSSNSDGIFGTLPPLTQPPLTLTVRNSMIYNVGRSGIQIGGATDATLIVENCTLAYCMAVDTGTLNYGCLTLHNTENSVMKVSNTVALTVSDNIDTILGFVVDVAGTNSRFEGGTHNASDGFAPGDNPLTVGEDSLLSLSVNDIDLHLSAGSVLRGAGASLDDFTHDIDGDPREAPWSIGADH